MKTYDPSTGEDLATAAANMVQLAHKSKTTVMSYFGNMTLVATAQSSVGDIIDSFKKESQKRRMQFGEVTRQVYNPNVSLNEMRHRHISLIRALDELDFAQDENILKWLMEYYDCIDHVGVITKPKQVLKRFATRGFHPCINVDKSFNETNRTCFSHYIIGRALNQLKTNGKIKRGTCNLIKMWQEKFAATNDQ